MRIKISVEKNGIRAQKVVESQATRLDGIHMISWYGPATRDGHGRGEMFSLVHVATGRACNKAPLTVDECERLVDELGECQIDWDRITDGATAGEYYVSELTPEAFRLAGAY